MITSQFTVHTIYDSINLCNIHIRNHKLFQTFIEITHTIYVTIIFISIVVNLNFSVSILSNKLQRQDQPQDIFCIFDRSYSNVNK